MTAERFQAQDTRTRLAVVESHLEEQDDKLSELVGEVRGIRSDFTELRVELAKRRTGPPRADGVLLPKWLLVAMLPLLTGLGAGVLELLKLVLGK